MFEWVIAVFVALIVLMIIFRIFFKTFFKILSIIWLVLFLASIGFTLLVYADVKNMRETCPELAPVFLLEDEGKILAGINMDLSSENGGLSKKAFVSSLDTYQEAYDDKDFSALLEEKHCKIVVFNIDVFENTSSTEFSEDISIPGDVIIDIIRSGSPITEFVDYSIEKGDIQRSRRSEILEDIDRDIGGSTKMKGFLFAMLFAKSMDEGGPGFAVKNLRNGKIKINKETITFKILKYAPYSLMDEIISKLPKKEVDENGSF